MPEPAANRLPQPAPARGGRHSIFYRFLFFDWLFADMTQARNLFERRAFWQHNRAMRVHLPIYLRRWACLALSAFALGCLCEQTLEATLLAACCFTGSCMTLPVMTVIGVAWIFLSRREIP